jgi:hypothetical protein
MTDSNRLFTDAELEEFSKGHIELALEALEKGDIEKARYWCQKNEETKHWIHDHYVYWVTSLLSHIQKRYGEDAAVEALKESYFLPILGLERTRKEIGIKAYIKAWVDGILRHHSMIPGLKVQEDDEKFIITFGHCGSGGFLIDQGAYDGTFGFTRIKKARPETWGEENVPVYCAHCTWVEIWSNMLSGEKAQNIVIAERKKNPGEPCILYFYKDASKVPEKFKARIGMNQYYWHERPKQ